MKRKIELLAPAKDLEIGKAAVIAGADAVYIGADKFGARESAANQLDEIKELCDFAHLYGVRIYVTLNTILYESELDEAQKMIHDLWDMGVDSLIIQDVGILEMDLPPIPIHASTQMDNRSVDKVKFLQETGLQRAVLARELSLEQIQEIRSATDIELEYFIHGALCVCYSGQCYLSHHIGNRSSNRGACAQPCRQKWKLTDNLGNVIKNDLHLLSLKDNNQSENIEAIINAGVNSLKVEGRLKSIDYVTNVIGYYRQVIDGIIDQNPNLERASKGKTYLSFTPDPEKSFNRGFTDYFTTNADQRIANIYSPKSLGKYLGEVAEVNSSYFTIDTKEQLSNGDGLCYFLNNELKGIRINKVEDGKIYSREFRGIKKGISIYRNLDHQFVNELKKSKRERLLPINCDLDIVEGSLQLTLSDAMRDSSIQESVKVELEVANNTEKALSNITKQLSKSGDFPFEVINVDYKADEVFFIRMGALNALRRDAMEKLYKQIQEDYKRHERMQGVSKVDYFNDSIDYRGNVNNTLAKAFYENRGVKSVDWAPEKESSNESKVLMTTKYCIKDELGICPVKDDAEPKELYLENELGKFKLSFDCKKCEMNVIS
ncbi:MAG: U32 family peptidase [Hyphomicrobiales bacterium]